MVNRTVFLRGAFLHPNESWVRGVKRSLIECLYIQTHTHTHTTQTYNLSSAQTHPYVYTVQKQSKNNGARDKMDFH